MNSVKGREFVGFSKTTQLCAFGRCISDANMEA
jgi:hypothetical protein